MKFGRTRYDCIEDAVTLSGEEENPALVSEQMEHADDVLSCFFSQSLDPMCVAGLSGHFKRFNPAWTTQLGWTLEDMEVRRFFDLVHPDDREDTLAAFDHPDGTLLFENRYRHKDGSYRRLKWSAQILLKTNCFYATAREVTGQKLQERDILASVDAERERMGRELHDGLCQNLAGIAALSAALSKKLSDSSQSSAAAEITEKLKESISEARDLARGLGPVNWNGAGLGGALGTLALNVQHMFRVRSKLEIGGTFPRLPHEVEAHLFRITQEAVNNAVAHGRCKRIDVSLGCRDGQVLLSVLDDGVGMLEEARNPDGSGLRTMAFRARLIGASLEVRGRSPSGTAVICSFPCPIRLPLSEKSPEL